MISTRGRYAIRVLIDLAEHNGEKYIPLKDIALRQEISKKYLEIIVRDMVKDGLITGTSGKGGGYKLCRDPKNYNIGEVLESIEGTLSPVACLAPGAEACPRAKECKTLPMWAEYNKMTHDYFFGIQLSDLL